MTYLFVYSSGPFSKQSLSNRPRDTRCVIIAEKASLYGIHDTIWYFWLTAVVLISLCLSLSTRSLSICLSVCLSVCLCLSLSLSVSLSLSLSLLRPPRERKVPGSNPACDGIFSGSSRTCDLNIGTPVPTLPGAWRYRVSAGTGGPGVSILWLGEMESLICGFSLSVAARKIVCADPSLRYTRMLLGR